MASLGHDVLQVFKQKINMFKSIHFYLHLFEVPRNQIQVAQYWQLYSSSLELWFVESYFIYFV